jgi:hypothetical protein
MNYRTDSQLKNEYGFNRNINLFLICGVFVKNNLTLAIQILGHARVQLVEALRYTPEGRGFDSR